ncbi:hypothetical protein [Nakamurella leprariae]|uniref:Uncharacterized protein n=1 Tax=Nakamurella leprariae TaxID=2803911 RepID=A0A938YF94_9ACTN|nr:hypothetical protein [Nakamurella leprariae]MBM9468784.1 hypothetical protein [Nakamurella leprariae]
MDGARAVVAAELSIAGTGYPDLVVVQTDGSVTVVECKLHTNSEIRRHVVGQILASASALSESSATQFVTAWRATTRTDLVAAITTRAAQVGDGDDPAAFLDSLNATLAEGRLRLVIAVDQVTVELRRIVELLNRASGSDLDVVCMEFEYVADGDVEIVIPRTYGIAAVERNAARRAQHNEAGFRAVAQERCSGALADAVDRLLSHAREHPAFRGCTWGVGAQPSASPSFALANGTVVQPWTFYLATDDRHGLAVNFDWIHYHGQKATEAATARFAAALRPLPGLAAEVDEAAANGWRRRPTILAEPLFRAPDAVAVISSAIDDVVAHASG